MTPVRGGPRREGARTSYRMAAPSPADLILLGGEVYTVDAGRSWAQAVAVRDGRFVFVGDDEGALALAGQSTSVIELGGRLVLPGFHDTHVHPIAGGIELAECDLSGESTESDVLRAVQLYARAHPSIRWIRGWGWHLPVFPDGNPHRRLLDAVIADRPAYFTTADGHSGWANSKALALAGIGPDTPEVPGGRIERDPDGAPSGTLREAAMDLIDRILPSYTAEECRNGLRRALELASRSGITALYDADADETRLEAYAALAAENALPARVVAALRVDGPADLELITRLRSLRERFTSRRLRPVGVKIHVDGVIEAHTAALLQPYVDRPDDCGGLTFEPEALDAMVVALDREGFQIHMHAIGDRAVRLSLDALARARGENGSHDLRAIIAHLELIDPADIPRFAALGVIADFQPLWAFADRYITELTEPRVGAERARWLYPMGSLARSGAIVAAGSDWNVTSFNPLEAMQVAVTRRGPTDGPGPGWIPEERVDLATIIAAYTAHGAYAMQQERETGSIEVGKSADLVVLDRNLFEIPPEEIHQARVLMTLLEGQEIYRDSAW